VTFARFKQAVEAVELEQEPGAPSGWCFLVLTLDREGYFSGKPWTDVNAAYAQLGALNRKVLERIGRAWGPETREEVRVIQKGKRKGETVVRYVRTLGNRWVSVVEAHRSGWPHVNLVFWCPELAALLRREQSDRLEEPEIADAVALAREAWKSRETVPSHVKELARRATLASGRVGDVIEASGWGRQSTAEAARDIEAVIGYGVKLAGLHDSSVGELAKVTQCPMNAPERFRRLRTGKGFFPPRESNPAVTGVLLRRRRSREGDWEIQAVNAPKDEAQVDAVLRARDAEQQMIDEEERILSRNRGRLPAMPPMRLAIRGKLEGHKQTSERRSAVMERVKAAAG
jgi:hypothetical protein